MNKLTKVVNIYPSMPITGVNPPIRSTVRRVTKSVEEIRTCLMARAVVEEILSDGTIVRLNIGNYDKCLNVTEKRITCGCGFCTTQKVEGSNNEENNKTPWQTAYDNALAGKDISLMTRKQRKAAQAAARAAADAATAVPETEVKMGVATIETTEEASEETIQESEIKVDEKVTIEQSINNKEEEVKTIDVEDTSIINE